MSYVGAIMILSHEAAVKGGDVGSKSERGRHAAVTPPARFSLRLGA